MKIGLVGSWYDMNALFTVLHATEHEFFVVADVACWPWAEKSIDMQCRRIDQAIVFLREQWVQKLVVPPWYELAYGAQCSDIIPLFGTYLRDRVLPLSTVWKLGGLCIGSDQLMCPYMQPLLMQAVVSYQRTERQIATRTFQVPFAWWLASASFVTSMMWWWSSKDRMVRKLMKRRLRYFQDAAIDTLIPCDWSLLWWDSLLRTLCRERGVRYQWRSAVAETWKILSSSWPSSPYQVRYYLTDEPIAHQLPKKRERLLSRGTQVPLMVQYVYLPLTEPVEGV